MEFAISGNSVDVKERLSAYTGNKTSREVFKHFYTGEDFQKLVSFGAKPYNPWRHWVENNPHASNAFLTKFKEVIHGVMKNGYSVDVAKLTALEVKLKKV